jgi:predicted nuclease of predicted toxin-antitoxin system
MRLLADENFPLKFAESEARIMLTLDKDFWQIAVQRRPPLEQSGVVLFRVHPATPERLEPLVRLFVESGKNWTGHVGIVSADGIQMLAARRN